MPRCGNFHSNPAGLSTAGSRERSWTDGFDLSVSGRVEGEEADRQECSG